MTQRPFPPPRLSDLSKTSASNFLALARVLGGRACTLVAGAGVSTSAGLPTWLNLLKNIATIYFTHWEVTKQNSQWPVSPPRNISIALWEDFLWPPEAQTLADKLIAGYDPVTVAEMIISQVTESNRQYLVRKALYGTAINRQPSTLMASLADLTADKRVKTVLSYNYDDLLERALRERAIPVSPVWAATMVPAIESVPIFYPHGYLKEAGGPLVPIILAEGDYHAYATDGYSWRNLVQLRQFSTSTCLFVGCSLTDPQVRRLLWVANRCGGEDHYAFLPTYISGSNSDSMIEALIDSQLSKLGVRVVRYPVAKEEMIPHGRLITLVAELIASSANLDLLWR